MIATIARLPAIVAATTAAVVSATRRPAGGPGDPPPPPTAPRKRAAPAGGAEYEERVEDAHVQPGHRMPGARELPVDEDGTGAPQPDGHHRSGPPASGAGRRPRHQPDAHQRPQ